METIEELVDKVPPLDKGGTFTGPSWDEAVPIFDALLKAEATSALVGMLKAVDDGQDYKARYLLHGLAQYLGRPDKAEARLKFSTALAAALSSDRPAAARGYCARQLQVIGGPEAVPALGKALADPEIGEYAAQARWAIRDGAAADFRKALDGPSRLAAIQALGVLKDVDSIDVLRKAAAEPAALWALARIGDAGAVELLLKAADVEPAFDRIKAASACLLLAENLLAVGKKVEAQRIYRHLEATRSDPAEAYLKELAVEALSR